MNLFVDTLMITVLFLAVRSDVRDRKIPNRVTITAVLLGLAVNGFLYGVEGLRMSAVGWGVGAALLFIPFALGWMGAGDVKLVAAIGALKGPAFVLDATLYAIVVAGVMAAIQLGRSGRLTAAVRDVCLHWSQPVLPPEGRGYGRFPFGPAVAFGALIALAQAFVLRGL